jgi:23S rRNA pseudouridine1911/1915/1917 synthase
MSAPLVILYEDNHCLAVAKPAGLLTQGVPAQSPSGPIPTLEVQVKAYLKERYRKPGNVYLGIPHRLDRPVSGVVLFARNTKAARRLAEQFQQRQVQKIYWAVVEGEVEPAEGVWEDWLRKVPEEARAERATPETPGARHALLRYRRLASILFLSPPPAPPSEGGVGGVREGRTFLEIEPQTGRMHQIRVQAAVRGWPICGDLLYGAQTTFGPEPACPRDRAIGLHARRLTFLHPIRYEPITVVADTDLLEKGAFTAAGPAKIESGNAPSQPAEGIMPPPEDRPGGAVP